MSRLQTARQMIEMTRGLNAAVRNATGRGQGTTEVQCVTCHRGVAIPKQLSDIVLQTTLLNGGAAASDQYRELRRMYYEARATISVKTSCCGWSSGWSTCARPTR